MFIWELVSSFLSWLGLFQKNCTILFLGLDAAGKSTLLHRLVTGKMSQVAPTQQKGSAEITIGNCHIKALDLGGHESARRHWEESYFACGGIVFLIDVNDRERFPESKRVLDQLLEQPLLQQVPIVLLGNKMDIPGCANEAEVRSYFNFQTTGKANGPIAKDSGIRPLEFFMCSVLREAGYQDALKWLTNYVDDQPAGGAAGGGQ